MPRNRPNIVYLQGKKSCVHVEAPHAAQASASEFDKIQDRIVKTDAGVRRRTVLCDKAGMSLMWRDYKNKFKMGGMKFVRAQGVGVFLCHPKDKAVVFELVRPYLEKAYDYGTESLATYLNEQLQLPVIMDGQHRYVGGDLNRPYGFTSPFYLGTDNTAKWDSWNAAEYDILRSASDGSHVAIALHSMDKRPHRRFKNEKTGKYEYDREIIIGTRFGTSVDPEVLEHFFFAFDEALSEQFAGERKPRVKIDLEFIGNEVLTERREKHSSEGRDVNYIQIEFMKYLLVGTNYEKISEALAEAIERLDHLLLMDTLKVPRTREHYNAEYTDWKEKVDAKKWKYQVVIEKINAEETEEPFVRLTSAQRQYLHVELLDYVDDSNGNKWLVKNQFLDKSRPYSEEDKVSVCGRKVDNVTLVRK